MGKSYVSERKWSRFRRLIAILTALCLLTCLPVSAGAASNSGSDIRLLKTSGTVTTQTSAGKNVSVKNGMKLLSGYTVKTAAQSYAWLMIDSSKSVKMNANSKAKVKQSGKKLEIQLISGAALVNVSKKLTAEESLNIRTSTTVTGIRGTTVYTEVFDEHKTLNVTVEGNSYLTVTDSKTGDTETMDVPAGTGILSDTETQGIQIEKNEVKADELPGFVAVEIAENKELAARIEANTNYDVNEITSGAEERLAQDEAAAAVAQGSIDLQMTAYLKMQQDMKLSDIYEKKTSSGGSGGGGGSSTGYAKVTTAPVEIDGTFSGIERKLVTSGEAKNGHMEYCLGTKLEEQEDCTGPCSNDWSTSIPMKKNVGIYHVYYKAVGENGYRDSQVCGEPVVVSIRKATAQCTTAPTAITGLTPGTPQNLVQAGSTTDGTIKYCLGAQLEGSEDCTGACTNNWDTQIPKKSNEGSYDVYYKVFGDANHSDSDSKKVNVVIGNDVTVELTGTEADITNINNALDTGKPVVVKAGTDNNKILSNTTIEIRNNKSLTIAADVESVACGFTLGSGGILYFAGTTTCNGTLTPQAGGTIQIDAGANVTVGSIDMNQSGSLKVNGTMTVNCPMAVSGTVDVQGTLYQNDTLTLNGNSDFSVSGTCEYNKTEIYLGKPLLIKPSGTFIDHAGITSLSWGSYIAVQGCFDERKNAAITNENGIFKKNKVLLYKDDIKSGTLDFSTIDTGSVTWQRIGEPVQDYYYNVQVDVTVS